jgi:L-fuculose-phosphate aldolase
MPPPTGINGLIEAGRDLYAAGLVTSHGGNLSMRALGAGDGGTLITATGAMLGRLVAEDFVPVAADGKPAPEVPAPSSNTTIHLAIYAAHREAGAIIHAHPVHAIARTLAEDSELIEPANFEGKLFLPQVPVLPEGSEDAPEVIAAAIDLATIPLVMVRGHGSFAIGTDIWHALMYSSSLEEAAQILTLTGR